MRRLIALGASIFLLAVGMSAAPAFAQDGSADQSAGNTGGSQASNSSTTTQGAGQHQSDPGLQQLSQNSDTVQSADSKANANQSAVNANVTVTIGGHDLYGGSSSATQNLSNHANSSASNEASTTQHATQGGSGAQSIKQDSDTKQSADSKAKADQNAVNANVAVTIGGGDVHGGNSSASQNLSNTAKSEAENTARTDQTASQDGSGAQSIHQDADTHQHADSKANADQNAVNANVPVTIGGHDVWAGDSSASQTASNTADSSAENKASTVQDASQCGCGGHQSIDQGSDTHQSADSEANAYQNAVNANVPVTIGGGDVYGGTSSASQDLSNTASSEAENKATTDQTARQDGSGGQSIKQDSDTSQHADSDAKAKQDAVNANVPVLIGGGYTGGGFGSASQDLKNSADSSAENNAGTTQKADQSQDGSSDCAYLCPGSAQGQSIDQSSETKQHATSGADADQHAVNAGGLFGDASQNLDNSADSSASNEAKTSQDASQSQNISDGCVYLCGGSAQGQWLSQDSTTAQVADSKADAGQHAVNAGGLIGSADQTASNSATSSADNSATTDQDARQSQHIDSGCVFLCGGSVQGQWLSQGSTTVQVAGSEANAKQDALNAGGLFGSATQNLENSADSSASNEAKTSQDASQSQKISDGCVFLCGGHAQGQWLSQDSLTVQVADSDAKAKQDALNAGGLFGSASQDLDNSAHSWAGNEATTKQNASQSQNIDDGCLFLCGGHAQGQWLSQGSLTAQLAASDAKAYQDAVNAAGLFGSASQDADNSADSSATNSATTVQSPSQTQNIASYCLFLCPGSTQAQNLGQFAATLQFAFSDATPYQDVVNGSVV